MGLGKPACRPPAWWPVMGHPLQGPFIRRPKAAGRAGCLGMLCLLSSAKSKFSGEQERAEDVSFTDVIPESASETRSCRTLGFSESCGTQPRFGLCSSMGRGEGTFWKHGPAPSAGHSPARDPVLPGCFPGCQQSPFWGRCFVAASWIGGLPKAQPAGPSCLVEVADVPSHNSQHRVLSGMSRIPSHPVHPFLPSLLSPPPWGSVVYSGLVACVCLSHLNSISRAEPRPHRASRTPDPTPSSPLLSCVTWAHSFLWVSVFLAVK